MEIRDGVLKIKPTFSKNGEHLSPPSTEKSAKIVVHFLLIPSLTEYRSSSPETLLLNNLEMHNAKKATATFSGTIIF